MLSIQWATTDPHSSFLSSPRPPFKLAFGHHPRATAPLIARRLPLLQLLPSQAQRLLVLLLGPLAGPYPLSQSTPVRSRSLSTRSPQSLIPPALVLRISQASPESPRSRTSRGNPRTATSRGEATSHGGATSLGSTTTGQETIGRMVVMIKRPRGSGADCCYQDVPTLSDDVWQLFV